MRVSKAFLPRHARYFCDDWADLYGSARPIEDAQAFHDALYPGGHWAPEAAFRAFGIEVYIRNVDAGPWEIFSCDPELLAIVSEHAGSDPRIRLADAALPWVAASDEEDAMRRDPETSDTR